MSEVFPDTESPTWRIAAVTSELAAVTSELAPVTSELAPVTSELAPVSSELAPVTLEVAPVTSELAPVTSELAPVTLELAPVTLEVAPVTSELAPVTSELAPVSSELAAVTSELAAVTSELGRVIFYIRRFPIMENSQTIILNALKYPTVHLSLLPHQLQLFFHFEMNDQTKRVIELVSWANYLQKSALQKERIGVKQVVVRSPTQERTIPMDENQHKKRTRESLGRIAGLKV